MGGRGERQAVVLGEVSRSGTFLAEGLFEPAGSLLGDVFVQGAWPGASCKDALDGVMIERTEGRGVPERRVEIFGGVALTE